MHCTALHSPWTLEGKRSNGRKSKRRTRRGVEHKHPTRQGRAKRPENQKARLRQTKIRSKITQRRGQKLGFHSRLVSGKLQKFHLLDGGIPHKYVCAGCQGMGPETVTNLISQTNSEQTTVCVSAAGTDCRWTKNRSICGRGRSIVLWSKLTSGKKKVCICTQIVRIILRLNQNVSQTELGFTTLKSGKKEMSPECDSVCYEKEERPWYLSAMNKIPSYMTKVVTSKSDKKLELVYPHRNKPPFQTPHKRTMAEQYVILEPFQTLSYQGLEYLESCLSFESILDKLETGGGDPSESRSRAVALRLLLRLPAQPPGELEGPPTTSGRLHSRIHLSAKGKHHRVLTPRCDTTIIQQLGRKSAIVLLQKFLRGRAKQISMQETKARWEESYEELNGFDQCYKPEGMQCGIDLDISITKRVLVRAFVGQMLGAMFEPLVIESGAPSSPPLTGTAKSKVK